MKRPLFPLSALGVAVVVSVFGLPAFAGQTEGDPLSLEKLKAKYEGARDLANEPIKDLNRKYTEALGKLLESEAASGELDRSLQVKNELEAFGNGEEFDETLFPMDDSTAPALARLRSAYVTQRSLLEKEVAPQFAALQSKYIEALEQLEREHTRLQNFDAAVKIREERESFKVDHDSLEGRIHFIVKGEIEMELNGERLSFRDESNNPQYISGVSRVNTFTVGDVISIKMSSGASFRSLIMAIQSEDGKTGIPAGEQGISWTYWSWNPNSGDTGGILADDWSTPVDEKLSELTAVQFPLGSHDPGADVGTQVGRAATFTIQLDRAYDREVTLSYATQAGTATAGVDFTSQLGRVTFAPGQTSRQVSVLACRSFVSQSPTPTKKPATHTNTCCRLPGWSAKPR